MIPCVQVIFFLSSQRLTSFPVCLFFILFGFVLPKYLFIWFGLKRDSVESVPDLFDLTPMCWSLCTWLKILDCDAVIVGGAWFPPAVHMNIYCVWFLCISSFQATGFSLYLVWVLVVTVFVFSYFGWKSAIWTYKYPHGDTLEVLVWCEWEYVHPFHGSDLRMGMFNSLEIEIGRIKGCNGL